MRSAAGRRYKDAWGDHCFVTLTAQQQQQIGLSSNPVRASTIRPFGGGVIRGATTLPTTAIAAGATIATTATTTTTTATTGAREKTERCRVAAGGARRRHVKELQRASREELRHVSRTDTGLHACVVLGSKLKSFLT